MSIKADNYNKAMNFILFLLEKLLTAGAWEGHTSS